jgi:hypothetical protein
MNGTNDRMSRTTAAFFLSEMARDARTETEITALRMAVHALHKRHFDKMVNLRRRKERRLVARALPPFCQSSAKTEANCQGLANGSPGTARPTT